MSAEATAALASAPVPESSSPLPMLHSDDICLPLHTEHEYESDHHYFDMQPEPALDIDVASEPSSHGHDASPPHDALKHDALKPTGLHSPPDSNSAMKLDGSDSELSDVEDPTIDVDQPPTTQPQPQPEPAAHEEDEDIGEVVPDHWSGTVPVFKPSMHQFKDFKKFMTKLDPYGMKSGILKIMPPQEWKDQQPALDQLVKQVRVKEPIKQDIMGSNGTYRQLNVLHQRSYNLPQWRQLCDQSEHQPPARRGERRAQAPPKPKISATTSTAAKKRANAAGGGGRTTRSKGKRGAAKDADQEERPMTPVSPRPSEALVDSVEQDPGAEPDEDDEVRPVGRMGGSRQAKPKMQSVSARRKYARREGSAKIDEEAFRDFDYRMDISDYTPERCEELERIYWKTLTYAPPLYGADVLGTLFDDSTDCWNLNALPNLLDVLGTKIPGVNTAYLYLGMWKATFAWHLEDVDLYSINYLHFGAPKQWYSISQGDARRFEAAMKSIWPADAKACDQFLRHKAFLISPNHLLQYFNIKVNKVVSYPGEFVVTYPYGYHSGYNLGYNCAEAVNFALDSWLPMGKIAKRCECAQAQDSVWIDVHEVERKLRGEETDYEETEDEEEEEDEDDDANADIPAPRSSAVKFKQVSRKRKRAANDKGEKKAKKIRLRIKSQVEPPCCLCPHEIPGQALLPTDDGRKAHRLCALYGAETYIETVDDQEIVANVANISKARAELKCLYCRSKRGACFQCSQKKCVRSYHATCAAAAGVLVEEAEVPIFGEDGTEYKEQAFEFSCRFHRSKRDRKLDGEALDDCQKTRKAAAALKKGDICQLQYYRGDIFAGVIAENRADEQTFLLDIIPNGDRVEVEWKWLLLPDPADFHLQKASANAIPMPTSRKAKDHINATKRRTEELPRADAPFVENFTWAEFNHHDVSTNKAQTKIDFSKENQIWYYLGRYSTDARPQYTEDPKKTKHNPKSNFLDTVPRLTAPVQPRKPQGSTFSVHTPSPAVPKTEKPYQYKPRESALAASPSYPPSPFTAQHFMPKPSPSPYTPQQFTPKLSPYSTFQHPQHALTRYSSYTAAPPTTPMPAPYGTTQQSPQMHQTHQPHQTYLTYPMYQTQQSQYSHQVPQPHHTQQSYNVQHPTVHQTQRVQQPQQAQRIPQVPQSQQPQRIPQAQHTPQARQVPQALQPSQLSQSSHPASSPAAPSHRTAPSHTAPLHAVPSPAPYTAQPAITKPAPATIQPHVPKPVSLPRPTPPPIQTQNGHSRKKSSISSLNGRLPLGSRPRFGTPPASYGSGRFDSNGKSPFSQGFMQPRGLGPSPSPQNGQRFEAQARARSSSLASNGNTPMTSSAIRPSTSASASAQALAGQLQSVMLPAPSTNTSREPRPSVIQKYAFFQVHHNRDSTKYRTPYAFWGGFTNGYEGNLRAHLLSTPDALFSMRRQSSGFNGGTTPALSSIPRQSLSNVTATSSSISPAPKPAAPSAPQQPAETPMSAHASQSPYGAPVTPSAMTPSAGTTQSDWRRGSTHSASSFGLDSDPVAQLHPAIRAHYAAMLQNNYMQMLKQGTADQTKPAAQVAPTRPVVASAQSTPAPPSAPATPTESTSSVSMASAPKPGASAARKVTPSVSTTPVPVPSIPATSATGPPKPKHPSVPPRQSYVPPPRPWETMQKLQQPGQQPDQRAIAQQAPSPASVASGSFGTTPNSQSPSVKNGPELSRHLPSPGYQSYNVSGPFWQKFPQIMPNSNSFNQPAYNEFQYSSQSELPYSHHSQLPYSHHSQLPNQLFYSSQHQLPRYSPPAPGPYSNRNHVLDTRHSQLSHNHGSPMAYSSQNQLPYLNTYQASPPNTYPPPNVIHSPSQYHFQR
ncbi:Uu.00g076480.m01.CDS01 [Anthostomella pinea]|uniref:[histone H3]-trimethyl-L-lysine(9) demethylase n=1 Tax=Anthostomella pinea TaxID=933095 RepID=A0AAI8VVX1_9PEZI|nr:Uu.00g076480.m01.CDS01 [Anthostomella pinea]